MSQRHLVLMCLVFTLSACGTPLTSAEELPPLPLASPTISPTQTEILDSPLTPAPLTASTPAIVVESSQIPPTSTVPPPVVSLPTEQLQIFSPGPGSQVTSPFQVAGWGGPSYQDRVKLRLLGEDGRTLAEGTTWLHVLEGKAHAGRFYAEVPFDIPLAAETGRLEISMFSYRDGQLSHLRTVDLVLLSIGSPLIHPSIEGPEKLAIFAPRHEAVVEGSHVFVYGGGWVESELPLTVEVLDRNGVVLGSAETYLDSPAIGQAGIFQVDVPYEVAYPQWGRIAVSEHSADFPGLIHYNTMEVWLRP